MAMQQPEKCYLLHSYPHYGGTDDNHSEAGGITMPRVKSSAEFTSIPEYSHQHRRSHSYKNELHRKISSAIAHHGVQV